MSGVRALVFDAESHLRRALEQAERGECAKGMSTYQRARALVDEAAKIVPRRSLLRAAPERAEVEVEHARVVAVRDELRRRCGAPELARTMFGGLARLAAGPVRAGPTAASRRKRTICFVVDALGAAPKTYCYDVVASTHREAVRLARRLHAAAVRR